MGLRSTQGDETSIQQPLSMEAPPSPLSSRPKRSEVEGCSSLNRHLISDRSSALPFVIPTEANPDFLLRGTTNGRVCGFP
jgi:hypothetical protein